MAPRRFPGGQGSPGVRLMGPGVARWLAGGCKVARGRQESDGGGQGWPGGCQGGQGWQELPRWQGGWQELPRWPRVARSRIKGTMGGQVAPRRLAGGQGSPGVVLWGPCVARWLPGGWQVPRGRQESDEGGLRWPGGSQEVGRWPGVARSWMKGTWGGQVAPRRFPGSQGSPGVV